MNPIIFLTPVALLILSVVLSVILVKKGVKVKRALAVHFLSLIIIVALSLVLPMAASAAGEPDGAPAASDTVAPAADANDGMKYIGAALAVGLAAVSPSPRDPPPPSAPPPRIPRTLVNPSFSWPWARASASTACWWPS